MAPRRPVPSARSAALAAPVALTLVAGCPAQDTTPRLPAAAADAGPEEDEAVAPQTVLEPLRRLIAQAQGDGRGAFVAPAHEEEEALAAIVEAMARAALAENAPAAPGGAAAAAALPGAFERIGAWNARARALGFEVAIARERETFLVVRELEGIRRGGGVYAFRPAVRGRPIVIQAPHAFFDEGTGEIAIDLFERTGAAALALNTLHRYLGKAKPAVGVSPADVANAERSSFQAFTVGTSRALERAAYVQVHGFAPEGHPEPAGVDVVASKGDAAPVADAVFEALVKELRALLGAPRVAVYGREARTLGATKNVQGRFLNGTSDDFFYHLELSRPLRVRLESDATLRARFAHALRRAADAPAGGGGGGAR